MNNNDKRTIHLVLETTNQLRETAERTREFYSKLRNEREKATFSMMMRMNPAALTAIRKEFFVRQDAVKVDEFIYIINKHLLNNYGSLPSLGGNSKDNESMISDQREFGLNMYELFKEIDVNGDGDLEWQEFTSYTVERANVLNNRQKLANLAHYHDSSDVLDPSAQVRHRHDISKAVVMNGINQFAIVEDHRNSIFIFNSRYGKLLHTITTEAAPVTIEYIPDREKDILVTTGADMTMTTYSLDDPNPNRRYQHLQSWATPGVQMALTYQPESQLLYSGATNGNIYSWNVKERNLISTLTGHSDIVMSLANIKHLNNIASASLDKTIAVWDSYTNDRILNLHGHRKGIFDLTYSSEYRLLVSCGFEHDAFVWSPFVNNMMGKLRGHHASLVGCIAIEGTPELVTGDTNGVFKLWDVRNFNCVQTFTTTNTSSNTGKEHSKMSCFFYTSLPSRNAMQKEDDSRIYAASKMLTSFDQARIVHEATTDKTNVFWLTFNVDRSIFVTVSERNVMIWDAFMGSTTTVNTNICGEEITACCLDDRKRKILIGNIHGNIGVYNLSNGALMKQIEKSNHSHYGTVMSLVYVDESKRFIAAYQYGNISIYDENTLEECTFVRSFETINKIRTMNSINIDDSRDGFNKICFHPFDYSVGSIAPASNYAKLWNYQTGKVEYELRACNDDKEHIVTIEFLFPYPLVVTCDNVGNVVIWGSRGSKWPGMRISGFSNQNVINGVYKQNDKEIYSFSEEVHPPMVLPPTHNNLVLDNFSPSSVHGSSRIHSPMSGPKSGPRSEPRSGPRSDQKSGIIGKKAFFHDNHNDNNNNSNNNNNNEEEGSQNLYGENALRSPIGSKGIVTTEYLKTLKFMDSSINEMMAVTSVNDVKQLIQESELKWGPIAPVQALSWSSDKKLIFVADDMGILRCFDLKDLFYDINSEIMLQNCKNSCNSNITSDYHMKEYCRRHPRTVKSALPPCHQSFMRYLIGKPDDAMSNMGINFVWSLLAHDDRIIACHCTPNGILTSAVDRLVKMWTFQGEPVGRLLQSVPTGIRNKAWKLELDAEEIMKKEEETLQELLVKVDELASKRDNPDIETSSFSGMDPGTNAADFNRSQLRRRIDITGKVLGLDFPVIGTSGTSSVIESRLQSRRSSEARRTSDIRRTSGSIDLSSLDSLSYTMNHHSIMSNHTTQSSKSVDNAMKELKSAQAAIDYDTFNRSLTYRQRKTRVKKMNKLSNQFIDNIKTKLGTSNTNPVILSTLENEKVIEKANINFDIYALKDFKKKSSSRSSNSLDNTSNNMSLNLMKLDQGSTMSAATMSNSYASSSSSYTDLRSFYNQGMETEMGLGILSGQESGNSGGGGGFFSPRSNVIEDTEQFVKESARNAKLAASCSKYLSFDELEKAIAHSNQPLQLSKSIRSTPAIKDRLLSFHNEMK